MDATNGLLSALVQTKTIQQILSPIAAQVSQLIIINEAYESGQSSAFNSDVLKSAENVAGASEELVNAALRLCTSTEDQELRSRMPDACDLLSAAGQHLVMATQRVVMEPHRTEVRRNVVRRAKEVLEGTMKVLLVTDEAEVRKIVRTAHFLIDRVTLLESVKTMQALVPCFKGFTEALILLTKLVEKRLKELTHPKQRERLITATTLLKKSVPMLNSSLQTYVKYLSNTQAQASRNFVITEVISVTNDIIHAVENKLCDEDEDEDADEIGYFVSKTDEVLDRLADDRRFELNDNFEELWEAIVRHSMSVAHLADDGGRSLIVKNCQRILAQKKSLFDQLQNVVSNPDFQEVREDYEAACEELVLEFQDLEHHVNTATVELYVNTFKETIEPLERLMKAALAPAKNRGSITEERCMEMMQSAIDDFNSHSDKICQVAWFIAASSTEARRVRSIKSSVKRLEKLDPEMVPAMVACRKDLHNRGAVEHLRLLRSEWTTELETLVNTVDLVLDSRHFMEISEKLLKDKVEVCKESLYMTESSLLSDVSQAVIGLSKRVQKVAKEQLENSDDPVFRNGLLVYVTQLGKAIDGVRSAFHQVSLADSDASTHHVLHRRCDVLLKCVDKVVLGLESENHPDLLDPARRGLRPLQGLKGLDLSDEENEDLPPVESDASQNKFLSFHIKESNAKGGFTDISQMEAKKIPDNSNLSINASAGDLPHLTRDLVRAAIAMDRTTVNLLCNDVMSRANNMMDLGNLLVICSPDQSVREVIRDAASEITRLTPLLVTRVKEAANSVIEAVEPMHQLADQWASAMSVVQLKITETTRPWSDLGRKICDVAKIKNSRLLTDETRALMSHKQMALKLFSMLKNIDGMMSTDNEHFQRLCEYSGDVEGLTLAVATSADMSSKTGNDQDAAQLDVSCQDWSVRMYCLLSTLTTICTRAVQQYRGSQEEFKGQFSDFMRDTLALKNMAEWSQAICKDSSKQQQMETLVNDLDLATRDMAKQNASGRLGGILETSMEALYEPYRHAIAQLIWIRKAQQLTRVQDDATNKLSEALYRLAYAAFALHAATATTRADCVRDFKKHASQVTGCFNKIRDRTLAAIQVSDDIERKSAIRRCIDVLGEVTPSLISTAETLSDSASDDNMTVFNQYRRKWVATVCRLLLLVGSMPEVNGTDIEDLVIPAAHSSQLSPPAAPTISPHQTSVTQPNVSASQQTVGTSVKVPSTLSTPDKATQTDNKGQHSLDDVDMSASFVTDLSSRLAATTSTPVARSTSGQPTMVSKLANQTEGAKPTHASTQKMTLKMSSPDLSQSFTHPVTLRKQAVSFSNAPRRVQVLPPRPPSALSLRTNVSGRAISAAAKLLQFETEKWEDSNNPIVKVAKEMSHQMQTMAQFAQSAKSLQEMPEFINTAKAIAKNGSTIVKFAEVIADYCVDKRFAKDLTFYAAHIPTISTQLSIISSVKAATPDDRSADKVLVKNADNLMKAVSNTLKAAEAACVKGLRQPPSDAVDETRAVVLAMQWKKKLLNYRRAETSYADTDELGLRKITRQSSGPQLSEILLRR